MLNLNIFRIDHIGDRADEHTSVCKVLMTDARISVSTFGPILNAAGKRTLGKRTFSFVDGYPNSNEYYLSFEAAKAAGIALAQQAGFIVAETDEEAEKMMLLV